MSSLYFKHTALSEVKLHLAPAPLYEYSHFISVPLSWLADFDVLARLWLEERNREEMNKRWREIGALLCFAGPRWADEAIRFLFPIVFFNRLNLHVAMATTTDNGTVLRYSYSRWNTSISEGKKERRMRGFERGYTLEQAVKFLYCFFAAVFLELWGMFLIWKVVAYSHQSCALFH